MKKKISNNGKGKSRRKPRARNKKMTSMSSAPTGRRYEIIGLLFLAVGLISVGGLLDWNVGFIGLYFAKFLRYLFGLGAWVASGVILLIGMQYVTKHRGIVYSTHFFGLIGLFVSLLAILHHFLVPVGAEILPEYLPNAGGLLGGGLLFFIRKFFGATGGIILLCTGVVVAVLLSTKWSLAVGMLRTKKQAEESIVKAKDTLTVAQQKVVQAENILEDHVRERIRNSFYNQDKDESFDEVFAANDTSGGSTEALSAPAFSAFSIQEAPVLQQTQDEADDFFAALEPAAAQEESARLDFSEMHREEDVAAEIVSKEIAQEESTDEGESPSFSIAYASDKIDTMPEIAAEPPPDIPDDFDVVPLPADVPMTMEVQDKRLARMQPTTSTQAMTATLPQEASLPPPAVADTSPPAVSTTPQPISEAQAQAAVHPAEKPYELPKVDEILAAEVKKKNLALEREIAENAQTLSQTLENFKVKAKIINACHGPAVTRYELEPAPGVKVSKITNLADDLALSLAAFSVRIEPIPGKAAIGIEVPNKELEGIRLREVLEKPAFAEAKSKLTVGLGVDIAGQGIFADLAKMPHLLVAGATGSGKSVCINTLITSVLFKAKPDEVKFILIDPKMVELSNYNGIPHLMVPVVTDAKKAASVLNWSVQEMEKRYAKFADTGVRDMTRFNAAKPEEKMPALIIIIDELADLMMVAPHDVEDAICRLAQKARAAGIHLVLATQRPSVDVITGIIKANIPSRISFAVSSQIDSRTILDMSGAEKLLGKGDMLFYPVGSAKPQRVQGAFVSDEEVERLLDFIRSQGQEMEENQEIIEYTENAAMEADESKKDMTKEKVDELLGDAIELVMNSGQASTSSIQRRFRIGYTRAARLIDTMEEMKIIGPSVGSKPREILVSSE
ncbi:DNA translocase FtsK 4TM domain-containing protein, partial [Selenomonas sp.]|uniref:DNA translocase FtsK 4TM domain-containing protein n=1 Tax=Selenomonas sp. TaxID=2053611 RepID=UPI003FA2DE0A